MKRKKVLLNVAAIFLAGLLTISANAAKTKQPDTEISKKEIQEILDKKDVSGIKPAAITVVYDYDGLKNALEAEADNILVMQDIYFEDMLIIRNDVYFLGLSDITFYYSGEERHFKIWNDEERDKEQIEVEFNGIVIDGRNKQGGIWSELSLHLKGAVIRNCGEDIEDTNEGGALRIATGTTLSDCLLENNIGSQGGAIFGEFNLVIDNGSVIRNNHAQAGGGIFMYGGPVDVKDGSIIDSNTAVYGGGGIWSPFINISGSCSITNNEIEEGLGGGIHAMIEHVEIGPEVIFEGNKAPEGYLMTKEEDIAIHNEAVKTTYFSAPFTEYAFNNYDISYGEGELVEKASVKFYLRKDESALYHTSHVYTGFSFPNDKLPEEPSMEGAHFAGWIDEKGKYFNPDGKITGDLKLYAMWVLD